MKLLILLALLGSCARDPMDIGTIQRTIEWRCSESIPYVYMVGDMWVTGETCTASECIETETVLGEYFWNDRVLNKRVIPDGNCNH